MAQLRLLIIVRTALKGLYSGSIKIVKLFLLNDSVIFQSFREKAYNFCSLTIQISSGNSHKSQKGQDPRLSVSIIFQSCIDF